mgnify:CR=1 FL=1
MKLNFKDTFNKELPADPNKENNRRQVHEACFSYVTPKIPGEPSLIHVSPEMLENLKAIGALIKANIEHENKEARDIGEG